MPFTSNQGKSVKITWSAPYSGGIGIKITSYEILIRNKENNFVSTAECDGTNPLIIAATTCTVSMDTLTGPLFNLVLSDLVSVKVKATNEKGSGHFSANNVIGALIEEIP